MAWTTIKVSSDQVRWPSQCVCCNDPLQTTIEISGQQVTGARYVMLKVQRWAVPYCTQCRQHVEAGQEAEESAVQSRQLPNDAQQLRAQANQVDVSGARVRLLGRIMAGFLFLSGFIVLSWIAALLLAESVEQHVIVAAVAVGLVLAGGPTILFRVLWRGKEKEAVRKAEEEKQQLFAKADEAEASAETLRKKSELLTEKCKSLMKPACSLHSIAIIYDGWYGNTHTFRFNNPTFVEAFKEANASIVLPS
jgi:hypothetical protein